MIAFFVNIAFCVFYLRFALDHAQAVMRGAWHVLPFVVQESMLAVIFLTRRPAKSTSYDPLDWLVAGVGTFAPLFIRGGGAPYAVGVPFQMVGLTTSIVALAYLRRSFGIVPANRGVVVEGPYTYVRHPMYAGHMLTLTGFYLTYPSDRTLFLVATTLFCLGCRIATEELHLRKDPVYAIYAELVPWRLIPGVF